MQRVEFYAGEDKHVKLMVHSTADDEFTIQSATWELSMAGQVESSGECAINEHVIDVKIFPQRKGIYRLVIKYRIADETLVEKLEVAVT